MPFPLVEIGYARHAAAHLKEHPSYVNSNYILNLVECAAHILFPSKFMIDQLVFYSIFAMDQTVNGDIVFSRLHESCIFTGTGFNYHADGQSNVKTTGTTDSRWSKWEDPAFDKTDLLQNVSEEVVTLERHVQFSRRYEKTKQELEDWQTRLLGRLTYHDHP